MAHKNKSQNEAESESKSSDNLFEGLPGNIDEMIRLLEKIKKETSQTDPESKNSNFEFIKMQKIPVLTLRDTVVFPHMVVPLFAGRPRSISSIKKAIRSDRHEILLLTQTSPKEKISEAEDLYKIGTLCTLEQGVELSDNTFKILVSGQARACVENLYYTKTSISADIQLIPEEKAHALAERPMRDAVLKEFKTFAQYTPLSAETVQSICKISDLGTLVDTIMSHLPLEVAEKQKFLETGDLVQRLEIILTILDAENNVQNMEQRIHGRIKKQIEKNQREYYLNEQLRAIHQELGTGEDEEDSLKALEERIKKTKFSDEGREKAMSKLRKLRAMNPMAPEANIARAYIEWLVDLPWGKKTKINTDLKEAEHILDRDHYGLKRVKERILEHLAVQTRMQKSQGQILCFVGPPGVGKTSLGKSIAEATGRAFVKVALGGVSDEAEIRGHRSTYIGAMPGRILQSLKKAKSSNPVFLLDEVDKLGHDWRGDPSSALLEVLDPEQNATFNDHYIELDYDLSEVMFIATANSLDIPKPLLDRMEIIRLPGYTEDEKLHIAKEYLLPKQEKQHGLAKDEMHIDDPELLTLIRYYTQEAGVRNLERELANLCRKTVKEIVTQNIKNIDITAEKLRQYAGVIKFTWGISEKFKIPGVATGLAWTEAGGDILFIEVLVFDGKGQIIQTGRLGDVMKESIQASVSYIRSKAASWGLDSAFFENHNIHIHVPEGATPKDGPSAGTAICTALASALLGVMVKSDVAMTGEVNLRGQVCEIGGLKEKLLAAYRGGIKTVIIPKANEKDLEEIDEKVKAGLKIVLAETVDDVLKEALTDTKRL